MPTDQPGDSTFCLSWANRLRKSGLATMGNSKGTITAFIPFIGGNSMWNVTSVPPSRGRRSKV